MIVSKKDISPNSNYSDGKSFAHEDSFYIFKACFQKAQEELELALRSVRHDTKLFKQLTTLKMMLRKVEIDG